MADRFAFLLHNRLWKRRTESPLDAPEEPLSRWEQLKATAAAVPGFSQAQAPSPEVPRSTHAHATRYSAVDDLEDLPHPRALPSSLSPLRPGAAPDPPSHGTSLLSDISPRALFPALQETPSIKNAVEAEAEALLRRLRSEVGASSLSAERTPALAPRPSTRRRETGPSALIPPSSRSARALPVEHHHRQQPHASTARTPISSPPLATSGSAAGPRPLGPSTPLSGDLGRRMQKIMRDAKGARDRLESSRRAAEVPADLVEALAPRAPSPRPEEPVPLWAQPIRPQDAAKARRFFLHTRVWKRWARAAALSRDRLVRAGLVWRYRTLQTLWTVWWRDTSERIRARDRELREKQLWSYAVQFHRIFRLHQCLEAWRAGTAQGKAARIAAVRAAEAERAAVLRMRRLEEASTSFRRLWVLGLAVRAWREGVEAEREARREEAERRVLRERMMNAIDALAKKAVGGETAPDGPTLTSAVAQVASTSVPASQPRPKFTTASRSVHAKTQTPERPALSRRTSAVSTTAGASSSPQLQGAGRPSSAAAVSMASAHKTPARPASPTPLSATPLPLPTPTRTPERPSTASARPTPSTAASSASREAPPLTPSSLASTSRAADETSSEVTDTTAAAATPRTPLTMEARAQDRRDRREALRIKQEAKLREAEEARQRALEEQTRGALEKRRLEEAQRREEMLRLREAEVEKARVRVAHARLCALADLHYHRSLALRCAVIPWRTALAQSKRNEMRAARHRRDNQLRLGWRSWRLALMDRWRAAVHEEIVRLGRVQSFRRNALLLRSLHALKLWAIACKKGRQSLKKRSLAALWDAVEYRRATMIVSRAFALERIARKPFAAWRADAQFRREQRQLQEAREARDRARVEQREAMAAVLRAWRAAAADQRVEREAEAKRAELKGKINGWIAEIRREKRAAGLAADHSNTPYSAQCSAIVLELNGP